MPERIVITGAGVVSSLGSGLEEFERALYQGASGIRAGGWGGGEGEGGHPIAVADMPDFAPEQWLGNKGLRVLDRSARLLCVAAHLALKGSGLSAGESGDDGTGLGMICGTMFGGLHSIVSFDWSGLTDGPSYVNPMEFPNTVINSPAGQAAIKFKLRGINSTVCAGLASGLYAIHYGAEALRLGRARALLAGGVEELCEESVLGFRKAEVTSASGCARPFRKDGDGPVLGEGSALLVLECAATAAGRGGASAAPPWAEITGFGLAHDARHINAYDVSGRGAAAAMEQAMMAAGAGPERIGCIIAGASGSRAGDAMEARALEHVFQRRLPEIPVSAPKAAFGEVMGASGALCALAGAIAVRKGLAPPTAGVDRPIDGLRLAATPQSFEQDCVLVNAFSCDGNNAALVLRRWTG